MEITIDNIKWFMNEREAIRKGKTTTDYVLLNSRFCNIHREDDKVTKWIFNNCDSIEKVFVARLINRIDLLELWRSLDYDTVQYLFKSKVKTNSGAYQFYPRKGETIMNIFYDVLQSMEDLKELLAIADGKDISIKDLSIRLSDEIGRPIHFYNMMVILDLAAMEMINPKILDTEPYVGPGGEPILKALKASLADVSSSLGLPQYTTEHLLCEFRKYVQRSLNGIPNNRKRDTNG